MIVTNGNFFFAWQSRYHWCWIGFCGNLCICSKDWVTGRSHKIFSNNNRHRVISTVGLTLNTGRGVDSEKVINPPTTFVERWVYKSMCWSLDRLSPYWRAISFEYYWEFHLHCVGKRASSLSLLSIYCVLLFWLWLPFFQSSPLATNLVKIKYLWALWHVKASFSSSFFYTVCFGVFYVSFFFSFFFVATCWLELLSSHIIGPSWCTVCSINIVDSS